MHALNDLLVIRSDDSILRFRSFWPLLPKCTRLWIAKQVSSIAMTISGGGNPYFELLDFPNKMLGTAISPPFIVNIRAVVIGATSEALTFYTDKYGPLALSLFVDYLFRLLLELYMAYIVPTN